MMDARESTSLHSALANLIQDVREVRQGMNEMTRDSREGAVKLERMLTKLESLEKVPAKMEAIEERCDRMDVRMSLIESVSRVHEDELPKISTRVKALEDKGIRIVAILSTIIFLIELGFQAVKWFMP